MVERSISKCLLALVLVSLAQLPASARDSLSRGQSPMSNFQSHADNKCPNEWSDYKRDKRTKANEIQTNPPGLRQGAPEGTNSQTFDDGVGVQANSTGVNIKQKCEKDQAGVSQQTAQSVPHGGPQPVTSTSPDMTKTDYTQPFIRPSTVTSSEGERSTLVNRMKRNAAPLGSALAAAAPADNATQSGTQLWSNLPVTSNGAAGAMMNAFGDQFLSAATNPAANALKAKADQQIKNMQNADNQGVAAQENTQAAFDSMVTPLINVANEDAAKSVESDAAYKEESQVIWMVQQMYKQCYMPMAILFLLPGALLTQVKSMVSYGMLGVGSSETSTDEDAGSIFSGLFRSIMAIFLIPATQLTISYCIDIGNALTEPVAKEIRQQEKHLMDWVKEQAYASDPANQDNSIRNVSGMQLQGKLMGTPSSSVVQERQSDLTVTIQNTINTVNALMSHGLNVLNGFQLVMVCYLFLLGPIAAALFAWPSGVGRSLFRKAYASWLDGVIVLCLWKFWWCIVLLCMLVRLAHGVDYNSQYEMYYYTSFMAILVMIPFQPFEFRPGDVVGQVLEQCGAGSGSGGGGGGSSSSSGGSKGKSSYSSKGSNVGASGSPAGTQSSSSSTAAGQNNSSSISPSGADKLGSNNNGSDLAQTKSGSAGGKSTSEQPIADNKFNVSMDHVKQPPSSIKG